MTHEHSDNFEELAQELLERRDGVKRLLEELLNAADDSGGKRTTGGGAARAQPPAPGLVPGRQPAS